MNGFPGKERLFKELKLPQNKKINPERLDDEIRETLGEKYISMSTGAGIVVRADVSATTEDADLLEAIVRQHDHTQLSKREQRQAEILAARERLKALELSAKTDMPTLIAAVEDIRKLLLHDG